MKRLFVAVALVATALGCGGYHYPGDIAFHWTIAGSSCADAPFVSAVQVTIPGERLDNGGFYGCTNGDLDGIQLYDFTAGDYDYSLDALNDIGQTIYSASGTVHVNGSVVVDANLTAPAP